MLVVVVAIAIVAIAHRVMQFHSQPAPPVLDASAAQEEGFTPQLQSSSFSATSADTSGLHPNIVVVGAAASGADTGSAAVTALPAQLKSYDLTTPGTYPQSLEGAILNDFPHIGRNSVSNESASTNWWHYPTFGLPSFAQITNNLRFFKNPDIGTCVRPDMCGALYHSKRNAPNEIIPLPPAQEGGGARVGYFRTQPADNQLYWSIPTNENILY